MQGFTLHFVQSLGLTVGEDVVVTGFDGGALGLVTEPVLTSARIPVERISRELVTHCLRQVEGASDETLELLVLGGST
ncbi:substrate-binding domain-containing protein [Actinosynnema sp. NPDC051121]|nr:substrate-binding domain-containing protein [Saccharothrix sp.]